MRYAVLSPLCATLREYIESLLTPSPLLADAGVLETTTDERALKLLRLAQELGAIQTQEAVSCLPVMALGVRPYHYVLDVCSAPGSKSAATRSEICALAGRTRMTKWQR